MGGESSTHWEGQRSLTMAAPTAALRRRKLEASSLSLSFLVGQDRVSGVITEWSGVKGLSAEKGSGSCKRSRNLISSAQVQMPARAC